MKFVIFDIDGTLTNTKKVDDKCYLKAFEQTFDMDIRNQKWTDLKNVTDWGITEEIIQREKRRQPYKSEFEVLVSNFVANLQKEKKKDNTQFDEVKGAKKFFNELRKIENFNLGIATGSWEKSAKLKLDAIGIELNGICFSNSDYYKSREAITQHVINQLKIKTQISPEQIIYFGDGEWDFKTCNNLGIKFIGIDIEGDGKLNELGAKTVFRNYLNKEQIIEEIVRAI